MPRPPRSAAQQASQPAAYPSVEGAERRAVAVLEVGEPAPQHRVEAVDDRPQALPRGPSGLGSNAVLELRQALVARPAPAALEAIAQEVEALRPRVDQIASCPDAASGRLAPSTPRPPPRLGPLALHCDTAPRSRRHSAPSRSPARPSDGPAGRGRCCSAAARSPRLAACLRSGVHAAKPSRTPCLQERLEQPQDPPVRSPSGRPRPAGGRAGSCRSSSSDRRRRRTPHRPSAAHRPAAAHPCSPCRGESRSCAPRSRARRSVPAPAATPSEPPGLAPSVSPAAASPVLPGLGM